MAYPDRVKFLTAVFTAMEQAVNESKSEHPHDIMCQVLTVAEGLYVFSETMDWNYNA